MLCQFAADATGLPVYAGPVENTAIGNILVQAIALGAVKSHTELRDIVKQSFPLTAYEPHLPGTGTNATPVFCRLKVKPEIKGQASPVNFEIVRKLSIVL